MTNCPHEYRSASLGHSNSVCRWCGGTPRENEILGPNHCSARAAKDENWTAPLPTHPALPKGTNLFAVNPKTNEWFYINHAGTWQTMPDPVQAAKIAELERIIAARDAQLTAEIAMTQKFAAMYDELVSQRRDNQTEDDDPLEANRDTIDRLTRELAEARAALAKAQQPTWFYHPSYTESCDFDVYDVIDRYDPEPGHHILEVECARSLPSIWCAVHVRTTEEMDALESDDRVVFTEHATEEAARTYLERNPEQ